MTASMEAGARAIEYLEKVDEIKKRCGNIKGDLSGAMKRGIKDTVEIVKVLARRAQIRQDKKRVSERDSEREASMDREIRRLKNTNEELERSLVIKSKDEEMREKEIAMLQNVIKDMRNEINALKERINELENKQHNEDKSANNNNKKIEVSTYRYGSKKSDKKHQRN